MIELYPENSLAISKQTAKNYSTSFSMAISLLKKKYRRAIYAIYGFVHFADEIVDSFHNYDQQTLFEQLKKDTYQAIRTKISLNPILNSFQQAVHEFNIDKSLIELFFHSMQLNIYQTRHNRKHYDQYIYGSAKVVGLMCLKVFYENDEQGNKNFKYAAKKLGQVFRKINFLKNIRSDIKKERDRLYFSNIDLKNFNEIQKKEIEEEINNDFQSALLEIKKLNKDVRIGVYLAYSYFLELMKRIEKINTQSILNKKYRVSEPDKLWKIFRSHQKNLLEITFKSTLKLNVTIDDHSGFCFGVINAINKAENFLQQNLKLYCLGQIVHNEEEAKRLKEEGVIFINQEEFHQLKNGTVLFRAHGEPPESYKIAKKNNTKIIDASCLIILKFHKRIIESYKNHENIYIYGKKNHPEIIGLNGEIDNKAVVFETIEELDLENMPKIITLYSQTTKSREKFYQLADIIKSKGIAVNLKDTICNQVANREQHLKNFSKQFDAIVFVSGKNSSNGKVLYGFCKQVNPNSYFISNFSEIQKNWFKKSDKVGICGATSTPMWLMQEIKEHIELL